MKIIFFNVLNCQVKEGIEQFFQKHSDAEIFCLQEARHETQLVCEKTLPDHKLIVDYKYVNEFDDFTQVTCVRKDIKILAVDPLLKIIDNIGLMLHVQLEYQNQVVNVCNVHGISKPGSKLDNQDRILQSQEMIKAYENLNGVKILGGDFNLEIDTQSVKLFENSGYLNLIKKYRIPTTRNRLVWEKYPDNKQYFSDYVFVEPSLKVVEFSVPNIEISDHLPMILEVDL